MCASSSVRPGGGPGRSSRPFEEVNAAIDELRAGRTLARQVLILS